MIREGKVILYSFLYFINMNKCVLLRESLYSDCVKALGFMSTCYFFCALAK